MTPITLLFLAVSMSADAFAASLSKGEVTPSKAAQAIVQLSGGRDEQRTHRQTLDRQA